MILTGIAEKLPFISPTRLAYWKRHHP